MTVSFYQGDTQNLVVSITDENNNTVDISSATFKWNLDSRSYPVNKDMSSGDITLSNPSIGEVTIKINPEDTANLSGVFFHELEMTDADGNISTVIQDKITILRALIK